MALPQWHFEQRGLPLSIAHVSQSPHRLHQIAHLQVRIPVHRQRDRRMPGQRLGDFGRHVRHDQVRDEPVAERMEVDDVAGGVDVAKVVTLFAAFAVCCIVQPRRPRRRQTAARE